MSRFTARAALLAGSIDLMVAFTDYDELLEAPDPRSASQSAIEDFDLQHHGVEWAGTSKAQQALEFAVLRQTIGFSVPDGARDVLRIAERTGRPIATDVPPIYHPEVQRRLSTHFDLRLREGTLEFLPQCGELTSLLRTTRYSAFLLYSLDARTLDPDVQTVSAEGALPQHRMSACFKPSRIPETLLTTFRERVRASVQEVDREMVVQLSSLTSDVNFDQVVAALLNQRRNDGVS